jgi:hypothetical protein
MLIFTSLKDSLEAANMTIQISQVLTKEISSSF